MSDRTLLIIIFLLELLAVYNLYDTVWVMLLHLSRRGVSASGTIAELKKAMRRDRARLFVPTNGKLDSRDINCDYLVDIDYEREGGETVHLKNYVIPSIMKLTAGSASPIYKEGQTLPLKVSRSIRKMAVVDLPEVRARQVSWLWLILWVVTVLVLGFVIVSLISAL
ncbi:MAG: hypothetical protein II469_00920 [Firmicutes bacterium]|nr:hypothetical protein [Bacillota bacterium]